VKEQSAGALTDLELDALQEIMNISFGSAAADLAEIMDIFIQLSVPSIKTILIPELTDYLSLNISDFKTCSVVEQRFNGDFEGVAFLVFPYGEEKELISFFQSSEMQGYESDSLVELEKEVLLEIGNILIGACIGRIFELLESLVSYQPPQILWGEDFDSSFLNSEFESQDIAITMKTFFKFEDRHVSGNLFLINSQNSIPQLKKALLKFQG